MAGAAPKIETKPGKKKLSKEQESLLKKLREQNILQPEQEENFTDFLHFLKRAMPDRFNPAHYNDEGPKLRILLEAYDASKGRTVEEGMITKELQHGRIFVAEQAIIFMPNINEEKSTESKTVYQKISPDDIKEMARIAMLDERFLNGNYKVEGGTLIQRMMLRHELGELQRAMRAKPVATENTSAAVTEQDKAEPILTPEAQKGITDLIQGIQTNVALGAAFLKSTAAKAGAAVTGNVDSAPKTNGPDHAPPGGAQPA